jgi:putative heme degradation protein
MSDYNKYQMLNARISERQDSGNFAEAVEAAEAKTVLLSHTKDKEVLSDQWKNFTSTFYLLTALQNDGLDEKDLLEAVKSYLAVDVEPKDNVLAAIRNHPAATDRVVKAATVKA